MISFNEFNAIRSNFINTVHHEYCGFCTKIIADENTYSLKDLSACDKSDQFVGLL